MPYMISSRTATDGVSLSVSKSKLVYSSLIFVGNKLTLICLRRLATVSVRTTQDQRDQHLWGQKSKANGAHEAINYFACNFTNNIIIYILQILPILQILSSADW